MVTPGLTNCNDTVSSDSLEAQLGATQAINWLSFWGSGPSRPYFIAFDNWSNYGRYMYHQTLSSVKIGPNHAQAGFTVRETGRHEAAHHWGSQVAPVAYSSVGYDTFPEASFGEYIGIIGESLAVVQRNSNITNFYSIYSYHEAADSLIHFVNKVRGKGYTSAHGSMIHTIKNMPNAPTTIAQVLNQAAGGLSGTALQHWCDAYDEMGGNNTTFGSIRSFLGTLSNCPGPAPVVQAPVLTRVDPASCSGGGVTIWDILWTAAAEATSYEVWMMYTGPNNGGVWIQEDVSNVLAGQIEVEEQAEGDVKVRGTNDVSDGPFSNTVSTPDICEDNPLPGWTPPSGAWYDANWADWWPNNTF